MGGSGLLPLWSRYRNRRGRHVGRETFHPLPRPLVVLGQGLPRSRASCAPPGANIRNDKDGHADVPPVLDLLSFDLRGTVNPFENPQQRVRMVGGPRPRHQSGVTGLLPGDLRVMDNAAGHNRHRYSADDRSSKKGFAFGSQYRLKIRNSTC